jgi:hypothetical protein
MIKLDLPHALYAYESLEDGLLVLNVETDLSTDFGSPNYDGEALFALAMELGKVVDPANGYDRVDLQMAAQSEDCTDERSLANLLWLHPRRDRS